MKNKLYRAMSAALVMGACLTPSTMRSRAKMLKKVALLMLSVIFIMGMTE